MGRAAVAPPSGGSNSHYGQVSPNPKPEIRNPKEIREPKADSASSPFNAALQRNAEKRREEELSAILRISALNLRRLRAKRDMAVQRHKGFGYWVPSPVGFLHSTFCSLKAAHLCGAGLAAFEAIEADDAAQE